MPWLDDAEFCTLFERARCHTIVSVDRCYTLYNLAKRALNLAGDFAECGVYKGGTALLLSDIAHDANDRMVHLFDAFEGLPEPNRRFDNFYQRGTFADTSLEHVQRLLA
jgi:O-methyltransferase